MDDSDQDFADLCSKLLKRVRKKAGEPGLSRTADSRSSSQTSTAAPVKKRRQRKELDSEHKQVVVRAAKSTTTDGACCVTERRPVVNGNAVRNSADSVSPGPTAAGIPKARDVVEAGIQSAKDKVLLKMQQFRRESPQMLAHNEKNGMKETKSDPVPELPQREEPQPSDAVLALKVQQDLDREAAESQDVELEDRGLFFCQLCHRNLSHMTPEGRTQHLNRCLDETEDRTLAPPPPPPSPPRVPECPICGKRFKSQKSRTTHLKRCSTDMGVSPAMLLQCLQRQAAEVQSDSGTNQCVQARGSKRKEPSDPSLPVRKKPRKKAQPQDEETMVALALCSSMLDQEKERELERVLLEQAAASISSMAPQLRGGRRPAAVAGKGRGKRRKGMAAHPPPLLLIQDGAAALTRLQERASALLLRQRAPSPPTPTRSPSRLHSVMDATSTLWRKSALEDGHQGSPAQFYTPELREFLVPGEHPGTPVASVAEKPPDASICSAATTGTQLTPAESTRVPRSLSQTTPSPAGTGLQSVGSEALRDLMELAEEGRTLSQWGYTVSRLSKDESSCATPSIPNIGASGLVPEESGECADLCLSGFIPDATASRASRSTGRPGARRESSGRTSVSLSRLSSDLSSMVNNPQLSDVQIQVDSGEVYFVHSFMLYARCPLLVQMVHNSGFGVQEEDLPCAQRVLVGDIPGEAVLALLQYLYTATWPAPSASLLPHLLELATRFQLEELQDLCQIHQEEAEEESQEEEEAADVEKPRNEGPSQGSEPGDQTFMQLLRSMWYEEDEGDHGAVHGAAEEAVAGGEDDGQDQDLACRDGEMPEERVNEEEMEEIYEFAATQRKMLEDGDSREQDEEEAGNEKEEDEGRGDRPWSEDNGFTESGSAELTKSSPGSRQANVSEPSPGCKADLSLDLSYNRLFSGSWDICEELPSSPPCTSQTSASRDPISTPSKSPGQQQHCPSRGASRVDGAEGCSERTRLPSSPSEALLDMPGSLLPGVFPVMLGEVSGGGGTRKAEKKKGASDMSRESCWGPPVVEARLSPKPQSDSPRSICPSGSPAPHRSNNEPELIVLSDSSEEMDVNPDTASSPGPSPPAFSACSAWNHQNYTQIRKTASGPITAPIYNQDTGILRRGCDTAPTIAQDGQGSVSDRSDQSPGQMGFSPEVSWLVPATPQQRTPNTSSAGTQTYSSMRRMQLFPRAGSSSFPFPPSGAARSECTPHTSGSPHSPPAALSEGSAKRSSGSEGERGEASFNSRSPMKLTPAPKFGPPPGLPHVVHSSERSTPVHGHTQPCSSTPLFTGPSEPPALLTTSPLHSDPEREVFVGHRGQGLSQGPGREALGRLHLSPSDPSDSMCSSPHEDHSSPNGDGNRSAGVFRRVHGSDHHGNKDLASEQKDGDGAMGAGGEEREVELAERRTGTEGEVSPHSYCHSFLDEPPMAFNDSWGLDAGGGEAGCFSLRLEDSGGASSCGHSRDAGDQASSHSSHPEACRYPAVSATPTHPPPDPDTHQGSEVNSSLQDSRLWDSWEEERDEVPPPLSQRVNHMALLRTPVFSRNKKRASLVPITPMPTYSDMDTPELKNKLNRFGVRALPKRQMVLKLKEIHQYTHQLVNSDSEEDGVAPLSRPGGAKALPTATVASSSAQGAKFKRPSAPTGASPVKPGCEEAEPLSASQGSSTSSTAASEDSERSNPELCHSSESESDSEGVTASQATCRLRDRVQAVRAFILSDPELYNQVLQYQPLGLSQLQARLKAAGIRLGATKLLDYLDSQCITVTTAKPGHSAVGRRRGKARGAAKTGEKGARGRKKRTAVATE